MTTERTEELKPCPFCGAVAESRRSGGEATIEEALTAPKLEVRCSKGNCGAHYVPGGFGVSEWNTRSLTPQAGEGVERVMAAFDPVLHEYSLSIARGDPIINLRERLARAAIAALPPAGRVEEMREALSEARGALRAIEDSAVEAGFDRMADIIAAVLTKANDALDGPDEARTALNGSQP